MHRMIPENFNLSKLCDVFASALQVIDELEEGPVTHKTLFRLGITTYYYQADKLWYHADVKCKTSHALGHKGMHEVMIKLSNNGFLYSQPQHNTTHVHQCLTWYKLDKSDHVQFQLLVDFANRFLSPPPHDCAIYYNETHTMIDFKATNDQQQLVITFKPGYPEQSFEDEWQIQHRLLF